MKHKAIIFGIGFCTTCLGITLIFQQWESVVVLFKAFIGIVLALTGLILLFAAQF